MNEAKISGKIIGIRCEEPLRDKIILTVLVNEVKISATVKKDDYRIGQEIDLQGRVGGGSRIFCD